MKTKIATLEEIVGAQLPLCDHLKACKIKKGWKKAARTNEKDGWKLWLLANNLDDGLKQTWVQLKDGTGKNVFLKMVVSDPEDVAYIAFRVDKDTTRT